MAEVQKKYPSEVTNATRDQKRKGFWSSIFSRSSSTDEKQDDKQPKRKGLTTLLMTNARQAATREVMHVAEEEAMKQVETALHSDNNNGSQPTNTTPTATNVTTDSVTPSDDLSTPTNWAKRMVDNVQQKLQGVQNLAS